MIELRKIAKNGKKSRDKSAAKVSMIIAKNYVKIIEGFEGKNVDLSIVDYAKTINIAVGTVDAGLIKTLKSHGIKVIRLRQKKYLVRE